MGLFTAGGSGSVLGKLRHLAGNNKGTTNQDGASTEKKITHTKWYILRRTHTKRHTNTH